MFEPYYNFTQNFKGDPNEVSADSFWCGEILQSNDQLVATFKSELQ